MADTVCIRTYQYRHEAEMAMGILQSQGIPATVFSDDLGGTGPHVLFGTGGACLVVPEDYVEQSEVLLQEYDKHSEEKQ